MAQRYVIRDRDDVYGNDNRPVFGELVASQLTKQGLALREFADRLGTSYEFARRLVRGVILPSPKRLPKIAKILDYPLDELRQVAISESTRRRFGTSLAIPIIATEIAQLAKLWSQLTLQQKDQFLIQLKAIAESNKRHGRPKDK